MRVGALAIRSGYTGHNGKWLRNCLVVMVTVSTEVRGEVGP